MLLIGPRRPGKSTYLKQNFSDYKYVTLDDLDELDYSRKDPKNWVDKLGQKFIIDEAQRNPEIAIPIKWVIDDLNLSKQAEREMKLFLESGGFPEILTAEKDEQKELLNIYKNSYFTRDVASINNIENVEGLRALYMALIRDLTSRYEVSSLVNETGMSTITFKKYLNTMQQTGLLFKLYGYHQSTAKRYISSAKSYFIDVGILQSLSSEFSKIQLIESFVISEIEKRRRLGQIKADELFYYESVGGREIDLIYEEENQITVIEIKSGLKVSGSDLRNIRDFKIDTLKKVRKIIYYLGSEAYFEKDSSDDSKIQIRPIWSLFRGRV